MKIAIYASMIASERGHERNVSGHIQVPLESARRLRDHGHEVHLISNRFGDDLSLPDCMPTGMELHLVEDGRRRPSSMRGQKDPGGIHPGRMIRQLRQLRRLIRRERFDIVHIFGFPRSGQLGGMLSYLGPRSPVVFTLLGGTFPPALSGISRLLYRRLSAILASTQHTVRACEAVGLTARLVRHGVLRDLNREAGEAPASPRHRVLFWRDPSPANGADLVVKAYDRIAPEFPDLSFDFAIRPIWNEVDGIEQLALKHPNVHVHRFPYQDGITLPGLIRESLVVVMPFRSLSINPQLAIAESVAAGVPVIASDLESNPELVTPEPRGAVVPVGEYEPIVARLRAWLADRPRLEEMGREAGAHFASEWNWNTYADQLTDVYEAVTSRSGATRTVGASRQPKEDALQRP